ncbi:MAG: YbaK/EbsC family protein, partial [Victivallaceae bacterium]|nr:YbaK/EbsC family protein [Victivallaceae bacterium]
EFMAVSENGEDTIFVSPDGSYRANREIATAAWKFSKSPALPLEKVHTPDSRTIEKVAGFLGVKAENTGKAVFYKNAVSNELIFAVIRGDFEVNESKLQNVASAPELAFADDNEIRAIGCEPGFASPLAVDSTKIKIIVDISVLESSNLVVGANEPDYHFKNFNFERDMNNSKDVVIADIATVRAGDPCPVTGEPLLEKRGIEVGNIFQLGTKYTDSMNCTVLDQNGKAKTLIMGCYGIGVGRTMASVLEQNNDDFGPIWPITIAPFEVQLCALNPQKDEVGEICDKIYADLTAAGIEVLYDDRGEKAGFMFSEADLLGIPLRLIVSPKTAGDGLVEFKRRGSRDGELFDISGIVEKMKQIIAEEYRRIEN